MEGRREVGGRKSERREDIWKVEGRLGEERTRKDKICGR